MLLHIQRVSHGFTEGGWWRRPVYTPVLHNVEVAVVRGSFVALVGPSGCGKSTLLKATLGTHPPSSGVIAVDGREVVGPSRDIGIVYQQYSLFAHMTVLQNVMVGPKWDTWSIPGRLLFKPAWWRDRRRHREEALRLLTRVGLDHSTRQYPLRLSGGMRQRVAMAQALINRPCLLLLDEPFGALDQKTRESLQDLLLDLHRENDRYRSQGCPEPYTVVMVTHELSEAFIVADRVIGLSRRWQDSVSGRTGESSGATVVYDKATPGAKTVGVRDHERFAQEEETLVRVVFDRGGPLVDPALHRTYLKDIPVTPVRTERT